MNHMQTESMPKRLALDDELIGSWEAVLLESTTYAVGRMNVVHEPELLTSLNVELKGALVNEVECDLASLSQLQFP
jgi:hypothetical protein